MDHLRSGVRDQPDQYGKTSSLLKIQNKLGVMVGAFILATRGAETGVLLGPGRQRSLCCSQLRSHHFTPAWAREQDSSLRKKKNHRTEH